MNLADNFHGDHAAGFWRWLWLILWFFVILFLALA
jgi:hypothetical protein